MGSFRKFLGITVSSSHCKVSGVAGLVNDRSKDEVLLGNEAIELEEEVRELEVDKAGDIGVTAVGFFGQRLGRGANFRDLVTLCVEESTFGVDDRDCRFKGRVSAVKSVVDEAMLSRGGYVILGRRTNAG